MVSASFWGTSIWTLMETYLLGGKEPLCVGPFSSAVILILFNLAPFSVK